MYLILFISFILPFLVNSQHTAEEVVKLSKELEADSTNHLAHGFGDDIDWMKWEDARDMAKVSRKPIFLLIHKTWCHACQALKSKFQQKSAQKQLTKLAKHFVMVNTEDDDEPWEEEFQPDGKYIPRTLFVHPDGYLLDEIKNPKAEYENYKYYYTNPGQVMDAMKKVMDKMGIKEKEEKKEVKKEEKKKDSPPASRPPGEDGAPSAKPPSKEKKGKKKAEL